MGSSSAESNQFVPFTPEIEQEMLDAMGLSSFEELLETIPVELRVKGDLSLPSRMSEMEATENMRTLAGRNTSVSDTLSFLGGGSYDHFVPSAVPYLASRSEFATSYTPYQAEVSQGTLQVIYEFQTMICEITGMDIANASLYDGASAVAEACLLAGRVNGKTKVLLSEGLYASYRNVVETYLEYSPLEVVIMPASDGLTDLEWLRGRLDEEVSSVVIQSPNRFGLIEMWKDVGQLCDDSQALFVAVGDPLSFGMFAPPGECMADVYAGEGQVLGSPVSMGGPYLGLFAVRQEHLRKVPGRLVAVAKDVDSKSGFVLALQTREQHIRREKATSNICTNQGLVALSATIYLALLGREGFKAAADLCFQKSHYAANEIEKLSGFSIPFGERFFKEFVVKCPVPSQTVLDEGLKTKMQAGTVLEDDPQFLRVAITEKHTREAIDTFVSFLRRFEQ
tara:strand:+ start:3447 stop:4802 length:1356 start_codon:yes stop_codon:yes gene_type:complete